jgi:multiple sugar transport system ATP-binding protein
MNLLRAQVVSEGAGATLQADGWSYALSALNARRTLRSSTDEVVVGVRDSTAEVHAHVYIGSTIVVVSVPPGTPLAAADQVWVDLDQDRLHLFDGRTEQALRPD